MWGVPTARRHFLFSVTTGFFVIYKIICYNTKMKIGIVGNGYVGQATSLFKSEDVEVAIWDTDPEKRNINSIQELSDCSLVFVCVPTPMDRDGSCYLKIVEDVVSELVDVGINKPDIVVRSTVPVGTCNKLGVSFMPEFLTEANWENDFKNNPNLIFGFDQPQTLEEQLSGNLASEKMLNLASTIKKEAHILTTKEAELVKYTRNVFLATKVSFFNEIEEFCRKTNVSYEKVRHGVCIDERIGFSHTQVPGPDGKRGYGGTCFPKDTASLLYQILDAGMVPMLVSQVRTRNIEVDRPEKDWENDKGRAVI